MSPRDDPELQWVLSDLTPKQIALYERAVARRYVVVRHPRRADFDLEFAFEEYCRLHRLLGAVITLWEDGTLPRVRVLMQTAMVYLPRHARRPVARLVNAVGGFVQPGPLLEPNLEIRVPTVRDAQELTTPLLDLVLERAVPAPDASWITHRTSDRRIKWRLAQQYATATREEYDEATAMALEYRNDLRSKQRRRWHPPE